MGIISDLMGGGIGSAGQGIASVIDAIRGKNPEDAAKLAELSTKYNSDFLAAETAAITAVNQTMQAESASKGWLQRNWRPFCGLVLALVVTNNYIFLPYLATWGIHPIDVPDKVWSTLLAVVGISAFTRGAEKVAGVLKK